MGSISNYVPTHDLLDIRAPPGIAKCRGAPPGHVATDTTNLVERGVPADLGKRISNRAACFEAVDHPIWWKIGVPSSSENREVRSGISPLVWVA